MRRAAAVAAVCFVVVGPARAEPPDCAKRLWSEVLTEGRKVADENEGVKFFVADGDDAEKWLTGFNAIPPETDAWSYSIAVGDGPGGGIVFLKEGACMKNWLQVNLANMKAIKKAVYGDPT